MTDRTAVATKPDQVAFQKDSTNEAMKTVASDAWKPGVSDLTSRQATPVGITDAEKTSSSETLAALGFPKTEIATDAKPSAPDTWKSDKQENSLAVGHKTEAQHDASADLSKTPKDEHVSDKKGHDVVDTHTKGHSKSADHRTHTGHHKHGDSTKGTASGDTNNWNSSAALEKFSGTDGRMHTFTDYNVNKYMPKPNA